MLSIQNLEFIVISNCGSSVYLLYVLTLCVSIGFRGGSDCKESACSEGDLSLIPGSGQWRRKWQPTPVFFPAEFHGQRLNVLTVHFLFFSFQSINSTEQKYLSSFFHLIMKVQSRWSINIFFFSSHNSVR